MTVTSELTVDVGTIGQVGALAHIPISAIGTAKTVVNSYYFSLGMAAFWQPLSVDVIGLNVCTYALFLDTEHAISVQHDTSYDSNTLVTSAFFFPLDTCERLWF